MKSANPHLSRVVNQSTVAGGIRLALFKTALLSVPDGVVLDAEIAEMIEPPSVHVAGDISAGTGSESSDNDGFLAFGTESWVYDVADGREREFKDAVINTELVLEIEELDT